MRDCLVSPTQNVVCILDDRELRCLEPTGKSVLFTLPLYKEIQPHIISVDWVTGQKLEEWDNFIVQKYNLTQEENNQRP